MIINAPMVKVLFIVVVVFMVASTLMDIGRSEEVLLAVAVAIIIFALTNKQDLNQVVS